MNKNVALIVGIVLVAVVGFIYFNNTSDEVPDVFVNIEGYNVSVSCESDNDCKLVDTSLGLSCCWAGACAVLDYSKDSFIGVEQSSFDKLQLNNCPSPSQCGPAPGCPLAVKNIDFLAKCISNVCKKVPVDK